MLNELSGMLKSFLDKKQWSARQLAQACKLSDTTILRILGKEQMPKISTVRAILTAICDEKTSRIFLAKYFPEDLGYLANKKTNLLVDNNKLQFFIKNSLTFQLLCLLPLQLREKSIREIIGARSGKYLEQALNNGHANEINGKIVGDELDINTEEDMLKVLTLATSYLYETGVTNKYFMSFDTFTGNDKAAAKLKQIFISLAEQVDEVRHSPEYRGKIPLIMGSFLSPLKSEE